MARSRSWLTWILVPIGLLVVAITGMWLLMGASRVLHPNPQTIPSVARSDPSPRWSEAVDRARSVVRAAVAGQNLPGVSVAVGVGGDIVWAEGFGWANVETRAPVTPETRFKIGTASAALTSAGVGVLLEKGRLALNDEIQTYVPQFPKKQWPLALGQLMGHVGGVVTDRGDDGPLFRQRCEQPLEALGHFSNEALLFEPGTQFRHSKYGWILVSAAVEAAAAQPFPRFMREQVFQPLGMDHTSAESAANENPARVGERAEDPPLATFVRDVVLQPLRIGGAKATPGAGATPEPATFYSAGFGPNPVFGYGVHGMRPHNLSCYAGSMAFLSTPSDLVRFGLAINRASLLQPATVRLLLMPQRLTSGEQTNYGLGWKLETITLAGKATEAAGHDGELLGRRVMSLMTFRDAGIAVAVMSNISDADTSALALNLAEPFAQPSRK